MFYIQFSPVRDDNLPLLTVSVSGEAITVNGIDYDFSPLKDGDTLPASAVPSDYFLSTVQKVGDDISVTLLMPYRVNAPEYVTFPDPVIASDGEVIVPTMRMEV